MQSAIDQLQVVLPVIPHPDHGGVHARRHDQIVLQAMPAIDAQVNARI